MGAALGWGALAASSLVIGALLAFARRWPRQQIGLVLAFGAGALISAVSFELVQEGIDLGEGGWTAAGLGLGAIVYYLADGALARKFSAGRGMHGRTEGSAPGPALALGAFLDGIPEQLVLGMSVAGGTGVSAALLVAIFVSNLPEAMGSASEMQRTGYSRQTILRLWFAVAGACVLAALFGYAAADSTSNELRAGINGFAAGALLVLLIDSMIPEARREGGRIVGLVTTLGFAVAAGISDVG
jgi:zinc transporter, ZIP family